MATISSFPIITQSFSGLSSVTTLGNSDKFVVNASGSDKTITLNNLRNLISGAGGSSTFISLTDAPSSYVGQAGKFPMVNAGETALVFTGLSYSNISGGTFSGVDSLFYIVDNGDPTKRFQFQASEISSATTRTYTVPNFDSTFATLSGSETLLNKTITSATLITPILGTPQSGDLSNCTNFPVGSLSGLGSGVATLLATFNKANLDAAVSDDNVAYLGQANTFTAANTISTAGAASTPALTISGVPYSAGSATTNFPLVYINESTATASTTLSTSGTSFGINKDSSSGNIIDLMQDGVSRFYVPGAGGATIGFGSTSNDVVNINSSTVYGSTNSGGYKWVLSHVSAAPYIRASSDAYIGWHSGTNINSGSADTFLYRESAAVVQMGADSATPISQLFKGADARAGTDTNTAGGNISFAAGRGTGTAAGGNLQLQTAVATTTGTSAGTLVARQFVYGGEKSLTESSSSVVVNISLGSSKYLGGTIIATTHADDSTDFQSITDELTFAAVNKGGTVTVAYQATPSTSASGACSTGTLTTAWTVVNNGAGLDIKCNAASSLTQTTLKTTYQLFLNTNGTPTITP